MAYTLELENVGLDVNKSDRRSVVSQFLDDMGAWEANEAYAQGKFKDLYRGTIKRDGVLLFSGLIDEQDLQYETSEKGLSEMITMAEALKRNPLNPKAELPKVKIDSKVDIVIKRDDISKVIHSFDYMKTPAVLQQHKTNIVKYAQLSKHESFMQPEALVEMLQNRQQHDTGPRDFYRDSVFKTFSSATPNDPEWKTMKDEAFAKMKEAQLVDLRMATPETKKTVEARINLERKLFMFNVHEDKAGRFSPDGLDVTELKSKTNPFSGPLREAFMDYQSAVIGKDWKHTYANEATSLKVESKTIGIKPEMEKRLDDKFELTEAGKATIERSQARQQAAELARKQAEQQRKEQEAKLAEHAVKVERNQPFTEEAMNLELAGNTSLSPLKLRDFFQHTKNQATRTEFHMHNGMTTGEYINEIGKKIIHDDGMTMGFQSQIAKASDLAFAEMYKTHKRERDTALLDDIPVVEAKHAFEDAFFHYKDAQIVRGGQDTEAPDFQTVLDRYEAYRQIQLGRNKEIVEQLHIKGQSFHETMEQQFAYEPKKIVPEASRVARPDSKKDEPAVKLVKSDDEAKVKDKGMAISNMLQMRQSK